MSLANFQADIGVTFGKGVLNMNPDGFRDMVFGSEIRNELLRTVEGVGSEASAIANESYTCAVRNGQNRPYAEARGEEPDTRGYWRGWRAQALWRATAKWKGKQARSKLKGGS